MKEKYRMKIEKCIMKSGIQNSDYGKGEGILATDF